MNYSVLIENRRSVREFTDQHICPCALTKIKDYYNESCKRLDSSITTALLVFGPDAREKLEGAAGYNSFLVGAPNYLVLLSEKALLASFNAGYMMQDIALLHFDAVAEKWAGKVRWSFTPGSVELPEGYRAVASTTL